MDFLAILIAFIVSISLSGHGEPLTRWALRFHTWLSARGLGDRLCLALYALLPAVIVGLLLFWVSSGLLDFVVAVAVLLLAFKSGDQPENLDEYQRLTEAEDESAAWQLAVNELGLEGQMYEPGDANIDEGVQAGLAYLYLERFFVSVFWFMAFGVPGVVLVWLVATALQGEQVDAFCHRVKQALYWIPVRLMAFTLALMGNFNQCFQIWLDQAKDFDRNDRVLLITCLKSALGEVNEDAMLAHSLELIKRSQLAWLVCLGLMLILGI